jgi:hypothetical protein
MGLWDFLTAGTKHKGQHAANTQRGKHSGGTPPKAKNPKKKIKKTGSS